MAEKKITVVIDGQEFVSKAADSAGGAMDGFAGKIPAWGKTIALATAAFAALSKAVEAVGDFVMGSIDAYDRFASSQNKMAAQSKLTGVSLADLKETAKIAREEFNLGSVVANDAATTVAKYASRAGDATKKNELLAAALDLGAASGYTAAESMDALEQGLRGQDEGFDKLLGKNPSALWKEYADANGLAVAKMTDTQKRMAELTAVVNAGNVVQGSYNERIASGAGQTEAMSNQMDNAKVAFGAAIQPLRIFIVQGLVKLIELATPVVVAIARVANAAGVVFVGSFQLARSAVGSLIEGVGKLTGNKSLEEWGAKQAAAFPEFVKQLDAMEKKLDSSGEAATQHGTQHALATVKIVASAKENTKAVSESADAINAKLDAKLGTPMKQLIGLTEGAIRDLGTAARDQLPPEKAAEFNAHMATLAANAELVRQRITALPAPMQTASTRARDIADEIVGGARAGLDLASAFGVVNDSAARTLTGVINIGAGIAKMAAGDLVGGGTGVVAALASVATQILGGDRARKRLIEENSLQLERLRNELGSLSLTVTGDALENATTALGRFAASSNKGSKVDEAEFARMLRESGSSMADIEKLAKELGITIRNDKGQLDSELLKQLYKAVFGMGSRGFGSDFASQKQSVTAGFGVNQTSEAGQIAALANLGGRFSPVLQGIFDANDISGSRGRLASLFTRLQNGGVTNQELGGLTGTQFLDLITDIISRIDNLTPPAGSTGGGTPVGGGTSSITTGGVTVPAKTLSDVLDGVVAQTTALAAYHVQHLDLATAHLNEAKTQTVILSDIADSVRPLRDGGITSIADKGLEAERLSLAAERGIGASF
jgi:hypothetical protein